MIYAIAIGGCLLALGWFIHQVRQIDRNPHGGNPNNQKDWNEHLDD